MKKKEIKEININGEIYLNESEASKYVKLSRNTLLRKRLRDKSICPFYKVAASTRIFYLKDELDEWLKNRITRA